MNYDNWKLSSGPHDYDDTQPENCEYCDRVFALADLSKDEHGLFICDECLDIQEEVDV